MKTQNKLLLLFGVGAVLVVIGCVMKPVVNNIVRDKIKEKVVIANNSELWDIWSDPPIPIYMQFYMFNLTNPIEAKDGKRPVVVQSGPYTYRERREKFNITFNKNGTVTYRQRRTFFFMPNMSVGLDTDLFTTANPPVLAAIDAVQYQPRAVRVVLDGALRLYKQDIYMTRPVKELLWGYVDPTLQTLHSIYPKWFYTDFVGFFINKNNTDDGLYTVFIGSKDINTLGVINKYNGSSHLSYWSSKWANMVNGSDGTISPPFEQDAEELPMFSSDICRSISGAYQKDVETRRSISLRRYVGTAAELANASVNPDNIGFCTPKSQCLPGGLLNISTCQLVDYIHIPVVVSFPHFYMADPHVINSIGGMHPNAEEHETAVDVEPWTGLVLQAFKRLQINMHMKKVDGVSLTANILDVYLPAFWLNESVVVDDKHAKMLKTQLLAPVQIASVIETVLIVIGSLLMALVCIVALRNCYKDRKGTDRAVGERTARNHHPFHDQGNSDRQNLVNNGPGNSYGAAYDEGQAQGHSHLPAVVGSNSTSPMNQIASNT